MNTFGLQRFTPIRLEYNAWNGFSFEILGIEYQGKKRGFSAQNLLYNLAKLYVKSIISAGFISLPANANTLGYL